MTCLIREGEGGGATVFNFPIQLKSKHNCNQISNNGIIVDRKYNMFLHGMGCLIERGLNFVFYLMGGLLEGSLIEGGGLIEEIHVQ